MTANDNPSRIFELPPSDKPWIASTHNDKIVLRNPDHPPQVIMCNRGQDILIKTTPLEKK